ncbi:hypothetical protein [Acidianus sulfidivorans]|uniref:hypothetical protein n=1 Tax=Acidianus sulfidivorans TaxID=312539 RepID=UPI0013A53B81|nr:hypothetical protein [Acidianus sulfidivorans]
MIVFGNTKARGKIRIVVPNYNILKYDKNNAKEIKDLKFSYIREGTKRRRKCNNY